jgi:DNA-binding beta-propeller fold protein YncE
VRRSPLAVCALLSVVGLAASLLATSPVAAVASSATAHANHPRALPQVGHIGVPGAASYAVATNPVTNTVYAADPNDSDVWVIDGTTDAITTTATGGCCGQYGIATDQVTNKIYVSGIDDSVYKSDGVTHTSTAVASDYSPSEIVVNPRTNRVYVSAFCGATFTACIDVINGASGAIIHRILIGGFIAVNPATNTGYVIRTGEASSPDIIAVINLSTYRVVKRIRSTFLWVVVNPLIARVYAATASKLFVINGHTDAVVRSTPFATPDGPTPSIDPVTDRLYLIDWTTNALLAVKPRTGRTVAEALIRSVPEQLALNPVTGRIYVTTSGHGIAVFAALRP